jgi:uncharacterized protein YutE (UPF0331/DUF86 family)
MTGLRNILVHHYAHVDDGLLLRIMRDDLGDLDEFIDQLAPYIEKGSKPGGES